MMDAPYSLTTKMARASKRGHSVTDAAVNSRLIGLFGDEKIYAGAIGCFFLIFETLEKEMVTAAASSTDHRKLSSVLLQIIQLSLQTSSERITKSSAYSS